MIKRYKGAMYGKGGIFTALKTTWAGTFHTIRAIILIPNRNEKIELSARYSLITDQDIITLKARNWNTGAERVLFQGPLPPGEYHKTKSRLRD